MKAGEERALRREKARVEVGGGEEALSWSPLATHSWVTETTHEWVTEVIHEWGAFVTDGRLIFSPRLGDEELR